MEPKTRIQFRPPMASATIIYLKDIIYAEKAVPALSSNHQHEQAAVTQKLIYIPPLPEWLF